MHITANQLQLNETKAIEFVKDKGKITNKECQKLNNVSKVTAFRNLTELIEQYKLLERKGDVGAGTSYFLIGSFRKKITPTLFASNYSQNVYFFMVFVNASHLSKSHKPTAQSQTLPKSLQSLRKKN